MEFVQFLSFLVDRIDKKRKAMKAPNEKEYFHIIALCIKENKECLR